MRHLLALLLPIAALPVAAKDRPSNFARERLVAWCIVPFDAKKRTPEERALMLKELGLTRCAYDWRPEHVASFGAEIAAYKKHGIEFTAFWGEHAKAFELFKENGLRPQIWKTCPSPKRATQEARLQAAADALLPLAQRCKRIGSPLGLYNHGGWGGEPENLIAVCRLLREAGFPDTGIVYNFHHAHHRIRTFAADLKLMKSYLLCINLNGMNPDAIPKILPIGKGTHEAAMIESVIASGYKGLIGIIDHLPAEDSAAALKDNLDGLQKLFTP